MAFPDGTADFRSDTVTRPTPAMLEAMARADVGDDVYSEDPTVNVLQEEAAALMGKEAALFTPTGSMGNQLAIKLQTSPGDEVMCVEHAHVRDSEGGAGPAISGVQFRTVHTSWGEITPADVADALDARNRPVISLLSWENTQNGTVVPLAMMEETSRLARGRGLSVHLDGARVFNAAVGGGVEPAAFAAVADTVQFCFSKGLGAPVGSIICGPADLITEARRLRKRFGGGMRQVGVLAAAARVALARRDELSADHDTARHLAVQLDVRYPGSVDLASVHTNMVFVDSTKLPMHGQDLITALAEVGIRVGAINSGVLRFVTHHQVDIADADRLLERLAELAGSRRAVATG